MKRCESDGESEAVLVTGIRIDR